MDVVSTKPASIATVKHVLEKRVEGGEELGYEQAQALEHAKIFAKLEEKAAAKLIQELAEMPKMTLETATKIADLLPGRPATLKAILTKDKIEMSDEELAQLAERIAKAKG